MNLNFEFDLVTEFWSNFILCKKNIFILLSDELQKTERESHQEDQRAARREGDSFQSVVLSVVRREVAKSHRKSSDPWKQGETYDPWNRNG